jgi:hypothetical protein
MISACPRLAPLVLVGLAVACSSHSSSTTTTTDASASTTTTESHRGMTKGSSTTTATGTVGATQTSAASSGAHDAGAPLRTSNCFSSPGACGFPDPAYGNVGASSPCSSLKASGSITVSTAGSTVENLDVSGSITVTAANVTIKNVCVSTNGGGNINNGPAVQFSAPGGVIESSTVRGANATDQSIQTAIAGMGTASHVYLYNCGECVHDGPWTVNDSYVEANAADYQNGYRGDAGQGAEDHHEGVYLASTTFVGNHDTLFNPHDETAAVFGDTYNSPGGVCANHITVTDSLLAGGGYTLYTCASSSSAGASTMNISNNRFARCGTIAVYNSGSGGRACHGGADEHGYWPLGGYFGVTASMYCPPTTGQTWSNNVWDDDGDPIPCACLNSDVACYSDSDCCSSTCTPSGDMGKPGSCI